MTSLAEPAGALRATCRRSGAVLLCTTLWALLFVIGHGSTGATATAGASDSSQYYARMNSERTSHGRSALAWRSDLAAVAASWSRHMAATQVLSHNPDLTREVANWQVVGENVGDGPTIDDLDQAFWNSAEHRDNILDPRFEEVGVGSVRSDGRIWITIVFRDPLTSATPSASATPRSRPAVPRSRPATYDLLAPGGFGPAVARFQRLLDIKADGRFGQRTRQALVVFQRRFGLAANGVVGPRTRAMLRLVDDRSGHARPMTLAGLLVGTDGALPPGCMMRAGEA